MFSFLFYNLCLDIPIILRQLLVLDLILITVLFIFRIYQSMNSHATLDFIYLLLNNSLNRLLLQRTLSDITFKAKEITQIKYQKLS